MKAYIVANNFRGSNHVNNTIGECEIIKRTSRMVFIRNDNGSIHRSKIENGAWKYVFSMKEARSHIINEIDKRIKYLKDLKKNIKVIPE